MLFCSSVKLAKSANPIRLVLTACLLMFYAQIVGAASYQYLEAEDGVKNGGKITGTITFSGTPPAPSTLIADTDEIECGSDIPYEELLVNDNGGIKNVVLSIENIETGKAWDLPIDFVYNQKRCRFIPHVAIIRSKLPGTITNSDNILHNVHTISRGIFSFNKAIKGHAKTIIAPKKIRKPGLVRVKCDIHNWMRGWWVVAKNPYTVLTNKDGKFEIVNIPAGKYTIKIWHEKLGERMHSIEVKSDEIAQMSLVLG